MAWQEIPRYQTQQGSAWDANRVALHLSGSKDQSKGITIVKLIIGSNVLNQAKLANANYIRMATGTGEHAGKMMFGSGDPTNGRRLIRGKSATSPGNFMLPRSAIKGVANLSRGTHDVRFNVLPEGALEIVLPNG